MEESQMGLFGEVPALETAPPPPPRKETPDSPPRQAKRKKSAAPKAKAEEKKVSGLVPAGDVRLTANIRQDLHLKLKIASAHRRTTIGEILEELIEKHVR